MLACILVPSIGNYILCLHKDMGWALEDFIKHSIILGVRNIKCSGNCFVQSRIGGSLCYSTSYLTTIWDVDGDDRVIFQNEVNC